ncbi:hypothetical protein [Streptomyces sp. BH104]|uniref:hypothetical protein n=1 Tax=Streptomyces sp. BH104 TaxID=3410407 RepID=UPI003BB60882
MNLLTADSVIVWRKYEGVDKYGNPISVWDPVLGKTTYTGVSVQPDYSEEATGDRASRVTGLRLITGRGRDIDLLATDRVIFNGVTYNVDGEVGRYRMGGRVHHVEARLILFAG